jgi:5-deoxy-5-amino-3-dehydroquinate synthase
VISVPVDLGHRRYDVLVGDGARLELSRLIAERVPGARQAAVVTENGLVDQPWFTGIDPGIPFDVHVVPGGERAKTLSTVEGLCRAFAAGGLTRSDVVVAVGGGLVTDVAGFAAASYHRGTAYVNVATTLLAQVDAAIGGKTGVNLPEGKNLVGAFWQPAGVLCDTAVLGTLDVREWACGRGEMAKYAFLGDGEPDASILQLPLGEQVARCVGIKARVVSADEREGGRRVVLNYGHTLAHALEAWAFGPAGGDGAGEDLSGVPGGMAGVGRRGIRHGEAVAIGLVYAALLARRLGRIGDERVALHRRVVGGFDLSGTLPEGADPDALVAYMARDKKAVHDLTFVLDGPGGVEAVRGVARADALATLAEMVEITKSGTGGTGTGGTGTGGTGTGGTGVAGRAGTGRSDR